jgi:CheY-like chemotaxis protein
LTATTEQEALQLLRSRRIDLLTQDFRRPGLGGCEFLRLLKADETLQHIPVLGISAETSELRRSQLCEVGLDFERDLAGYLQKPFNPAELVQVVKEILEKQGGEAPAP